MKLHALSERLASLTGEYHSLATTAEAWTRHLASSCSSVRLDRDQWLMVACMGCIGVLLLFVFVSMVEVMKARLDSVEREIHKLGPDQADSLLQSSVRSPSSARPYRSLPGHLQPHHESLSRQESSETQSSDLSSRPAETEPLRRGGSGAELRTQLSSRTPGPDLARTQSHLGHGAGMAWGLRHSAYHLTHFEEHDGGEDEHLVDCQVGGEDMVSDMGISGLCLVTCEDNLSTVMCIACQAFFLQFIILFYIGASLEPHPNFNKQKNLPDAIIVAAIYVHFLNCVRDIPRSMFATRSFRHNFKNDTFMHTWTFGLVFAIDAFITPLAQLFIGALFLCTSATVAEVIMNACAVAYISEIDNMILEVRKQMEALVGRDEEYDEVTIPVDKRVIGIINACFVTVPLIPLAFSVCMGYVGLHVFRL